jgi:hypothetical protein
MTKIALMTEPTPMLANTSPSEDASSRSSLRSKTGDGKASPKQEHASEKQNWIQHYACPAEKPNVPADPTSHRFANHNILLSLKASASAPTRSVKRKNGSDARLAVRDEKADGDIKLIVHVAAVS